MAAQPLAEQVGVVPACRTLGVSRATFYRRQRSTPGHQQPRPTPARALCEAEREQVLDELASPRFVDRAPAEVVATLLDEGRYLCSERTMYRILAADRPVRERRNQREHPQYTKPELVATAPNQTWSWDITKLLGPTKWTYFYLSTRKHRPTVTQRDTSMRLWGNELGENNIYCFNPLIFK